MAGESFPIRSSAHPPAGGDKKRDDDDGIALETHQCLSNEYTLEMHSQSFGSSVTKLCEFSLETISSSLALVISLPHFLRPLYAAAGWLAGWLVASRCNLTLVQQLDRSLPPPSHLPFWA